MAMLAQRYSSVSSHQAGDGLKLIDQLSPAKNSTVLDLGCGTGYLASVLAERVGPGGKVVGVDPDKERIRLAQEKYGGRSNLVFLEGSSEDFPEGPYDLVFSNHVMHWVEEKESAFRNVYKNLRAGGLFALNSAEDATPTVYQLAALMGQEGLKFMFFTSRDNYEEVLCKCGFFVEFKSALPREFSFPNIDVFLDWHMVSTHGIMDPVSVDVDAATLADFKKPFGDNTFVYDPTIVTFILRKP